MSPVRVLLHGFTGAPASWSEVLGELSDADAAHLPVHVPALVGHDGTPGPEGVETFDDELDRLAAGIRAAASSPVELVGYSMGGRVALGLLVRHPDLFRSATLIGASPGLADPEERRARRERDETWARLLEREGLPTFVAAWEALPMFASQARLPAPARERQRAIRMAHDPRGLARSLRATGLAAMPDYGPDLARIRVPVSLVVGERDAKFRALADAMAARIPRAAVRTIPGAGHNVVLERPAEIARLLEEEDE